jgi:hypothetical protein
MEVLEIILSQNQLKLKLGFLKPKPTSYNIKMVDKKTTGLIINLKIYVHGIPFITMLIVL